MVCASLFCSPFKISCHPSNKNASMSAVSPAGGGKEQQISSVMLQVLQIYNSPLTIYIRCIRLIDLCYICEQIFLVSDTIHMVLHVNTPTSIIWADKLILNVWRLIYNFIHYI